MSVPIDQMEQEAEPVPTMTDSELASLVNTELTESLGGDTDTELTGSWELAMQYYFGKPRGDEKPGRSALISMDVADMVEQTIAQIMPAFDHNDLAEFEPNSEQDEEQAQLESDAMNYLVMEKNKGFITILQAVKDGFLQRAGILKAYIEDMAVVSAETYKNMTPYDLQQALQDEEDTEIEILEQEIAQQGGVVPDPQTGLPVMSPDTFNIKVKKTTRKKKLRIEPVAPEELRINADHNSPFIGGARFVAHVTPTLRSDLIARGYDEQEVMQLPSYNGGGSDNEDQIRDRSGTEIEYTSAARITESVLVEECYYMVDYDGDGIAERRQIIKSNATIFENDYFPVVPFAGGQPFILPHRFYGLSYFDKLRCVQDTKTRFLRLTDDNAEATINQRKVVLPDEVNMDDMMTSRPGGVIRARSLDSIRMEPTQPLGDTGFKMMDYMDKIRRENGGSALDLGTSENQPVGAGTAHGMERWMTSQEQLTGLVARCFAETMVQGIYAVSHWLVRQYLPGEMNFRNKGRWTQSDPQQWQPREDVTIAIGLSNSERTQRYGALGAVIGQQEKALGMQMDGVITDFDKYHRALIDQARAAGLPAPEQYWIDPKSEEAQAAIKQKGETAQAQNQAQQQAIQDQHNLLMQVEEMKSKTKLIGDKLDFQIDANEQLRKWLETELKYKTELPVPGEGQ